MKIYFLFVVLSFGLELTTGIAAQVTQIETGSPDSVLVSSSLEVLSKKGTTVYLNGKSAEIKKLQKAAEDEFSAWGYWSIVDKPEEAKYILEVIGTRTGMDVFSYASVRVQGIIHDQSGRILWTSASYKGESNGLTGFNPLSDALGKLIRRGIEPTFGIMW
ncbi:MAG TPA: hypothetical protein VMZ69_05285 [Saprospiraceae bacterium]|nr:hypothetical protein [Saprospiraceae bacterium]